MDATQVRQLLREDAFPHAVDSLDLLETHISWVVLTGEYAYKIKKPVAMGFLDFSTREARRHFCEEELRLNRRLAPELYLDVVDVTERGGRLRVGGGGAVIDSAVRMRQFPQRRLASRAADEGRLTHAQCRAIGRRIADFHNALEPIDRRQLDSDAGPGTPGAIFRAARQNFSQIDDALPARENREVLRTLEDAALDDYARLEDAMWRRLDGGFVRECHGDLHLGNILLEDDAVLPFDCIEFNPDFRIVDIQCEIGFLVMDLDSRGLPGHANRVLNSWLEHTGDYEGLALHTFYDVYLAIVRAKISLFGALASEPDHPDLSDYRRYLALAAAGRRRLPRFVCIMLGVSGSGKSTVAESLAADFSAIRLRSDVERKRLAGLRPAERAGGRVVEGETLYDEASSDRVFERLEALAETVLDGGMPVVVDATFIESARRRPFRALASRKGIPFVIVQCLARPETLERRIVARRRHEHDASEAGVAVMRAQLDTQQPPDASESAHLVPVDTEAAGYAIRLASEVERRITTRRCPGAS